MVELDQAVQEAGLTLEYVTASCDNVIGVLRGMPASLHRGAFG